MNIDNIVLTMKNVYCVVCEVCDFINDNKDAIRYTVDNIKLIFEFVGDIMETIDVNRANWEDDIKNHLEEQNANADAQPPDEDTTKTGAQNE